MYLPYSYLQVASRYSYIQTSTYYTQTYRTYPSHTYVYVTRSRISTFYQKVENFYFHFHFPPSSSKMQQSDESFFRRKRYYVILMLFLGIVLANLLNITLSICIVKMTSNRTVTIGNETLNEVKNTKK